MIRFILPCDLFGPDFFDNPFRANDETDSQQALGDLPAMNQKLFTHLSGHRIKSLWPILSTKMLIHHSKANLDAKVCFLKLPIY